MAQLHIDRYYRADADRIWQILTDFEAKNSKKIKVEILEPGDEQKNREGLIREIQMNGTKIREKILTINPKESIEYELLSGAPVHDYYGTVFVYPEREGTTVRWVVTFKSNFPWPEWLIKKRAAKIINEILDEFSKVIQESTGQD
jgi:hypothetical protein